MASFAKSRSRTIKLLPNKSGQTKADDVDITLSILSRGNCAAALCLGHSEGVDFSSIYIMKRLLVLAVLLGLVSTACAAAPNAAAKKFTIADYNKIKPGMTVAEVQKATGFKPQEVNQSSIEVMGKTITATGYVIANPDGSNASFAVQNGKLTSKMQTGLK